VDRSQPPNKILSSEKFFAKAAQKNYLKIPNSSQWGRQTVEFFLGKSQEQ